MLFSVVAVSETWLHKSNPDLFNIPGYHFISNSREHKLGGVFGLYIQSDMNFKLRIDLQSSDNSLYESVFVEIMRPHGKNIIVGCLYRPPDASLNDFNRSVEDIMSAISFENKLSYIMGDFDINFPNSRSCSKPHCSSKPWFSNGLFTSCKKKNSLYKQFQLNPTALNKLRHNKYRNKYNFLIKLARKKFFHDKLLSVSADLKKTWSVIKQIISKKEPEQRFNNMKDSSGYSNPTQIATKFDNFFANVGPSLANKISPNQITYLEFLIGHYAKCFYLNPTSPTEVANIVHSLKNSKFEGFDGLSISPVKDTIDLIAAL